MGGAVMTDIGTSTAALDFLAEAAEAVRRQPITC